MILAALLASVSMISTASPNLSVVVVVVGVSGGACPVGGVGCVGMVTSTVSSPIVTERSSTATATATLFFWRWFSIRSATCWLDSVVRWMPSFLSMRDLSFSSSSRDMRLSLSLPSSLVSGSAQVQSGGQWQALSMYPGKLAIGATFGFSGCRTAGTCCYIVPFFYDFRVPELCTKTFQDWWVTRWRPSQKRRAAGHNRQHVINCRLRVLPTCPEWLRLSPGLPSLAQAGSDSSRRARDMAATMLDHSIHLGESATKTVKFFAAHTVNCVICKNLTRIECMLLNFTPVIQQNCHQPGRNCEKSFCAVDRLSCQNPKPANSEAILFLIVNFVHVIFLHGV